MGETLLVGGALLLGGMIASFVKTHLFYRHKSQKFKDAYQAKLWDILHHKYSENEAYWISRALTDYIYDFSKRLYEDVHIERFIGHATEERKNLYKYKIESPQILCEELVLRAIELNVPATLFFSHMKELWGDYLIPMGKLTPNSIQSMTGANSYYLELTKLPVSTKQMTHFLDTTQSE